MPANAGIQARWVSAMRRGDFVGAWAINDAVLASGGMPDDPRLPYHLRFVWDGRPFDGLHVVVRCYHGLGDTIQFARYLPALRRRTASVTLETQRELVPLLQSIPGVDQLVPFRAAAPIPRGERDLEIMELSHALRLGPVGGAYLSAPTDMDQTRGRLGGGRLIGLCCTAGDWDGERSVPAVELAPTLRIPRLRLVRLQRSAGAPLSWVNPEDRLEDLLQTATLVAACDLIITVDTMIAHLAGAMGRPVWLLLKADADWRWMTGRNDSPWYPTMRLYRQARPGDWSVPLAHIANDLAGWAGIRHGRDEAQVVQESLSFTPD